MIEVPMIGNPCQFQEYSFCMSKYRDEHPEHLLDQPIPDDGARNSPPQCSHRPLEAAVNYYISLISCVGISPHRALSQNNDTIRTDQPDSRDRRRALWSRRSQV